MAEDYAHAITSALQMDLPRQAELYIRNNADYYTQHMPEEEFALAALRMLTPIPAERLLRGLKHVGFVVSEARLEMRLQQLKSSHLLYRTTASYVTRIRSPTGS